MQGLLDFLQGASNSAASNVSAPVDGLAWLLRKAGLPIPANPIGGSDWMAEKGLTAQPKSKNLGLLGEAIGGVAPIVAAAKAPQIAKGLLQAGDNLAAPQVLRKESGMFIGPSAKTWDAEAASKAQQLAAKGVEPRAIWAETGTWKGPDGKWRQEIPDNNSLFNSSVVGGKKQQNDLTVGMADIDLGPTVGGILEHDQLKAAYGTGLTKSTYVGNKNTLFGDGTQGAYDDLTGRLTLNAPAKADDARTTAIHELQHAIQQREGFAKGGAPGANGLTWDELSGEGRKIYENSRNHYDDPILKEIFEGSAPLKPWDEMTAISRTPYIEQAQEGAYRRLAGEAEARATEKRINLNAEQRRALFPEDSYDVPINQLIIRGLL